MVTPIVPFACLLGALFERFTALLTSNLDTREHLTQALIDQGIDEWARLNP